MLSKFASFSVPLPEVIKEAKDLRWGKCRHILKFSNGKLQKWRRYSHWPIWVEEKGHCKNPSCARSVWATFASHQKKKTALCNTASSDGQSFKWVVPQCLQATFRTETILKSYSYDAFTFKMELTLACWSFFFLLYFTHVNEINYVQIENKTLFFICAPLRYNVAYKQRTPKTSPIKKDLTFL